RVADRTIEGAKATARRADVGVVDVAVDDVGDDVVRVLGAAHRIGRETEVEERGLARQPHRVASREPFAERSSFEPGVDARRRPSASAPRSASWSESDMSFRWRAPQAAKTNGSPVHSNHA